MSQGLRRVGKIGPHGNDRMMALLNVAIYDATIAAWDSKYAHNRRRPTEIDPTLATAMSNPRSPSYPSEHAVVAGAASVVLGYVMPDDAQLFAAKAEEAGAAAPAGWDRIPERRQGRAPAGTRGG